MRKSQKDRKLNACEVCPCESGLTYADCCLKKGIEYLIAPSGAVFRRLPISAPLAEQLKDGQRRFKEVFGRKPGRGDLVLFEQFLDGKEDRWQAIERVARHAKLPEEFIFAWRRTGILVAEQNLNLLPDVELEEWDDAIDEYFRIKEDGYDPFYVFTYLGPEEYEHYKRCVTLIQNIIVVSFNSIRRKKRFAESRAHFQYLVACSALNSFRTINEMFKSRYDDDCLAILRGIYEQYLRIKYLRLKPEFLKQYEAAVCATAGVFRYKERPDGSLDFTTVVDPKSGEETKVRTSNVTIVRNSDFAHDEIIYQELYNQLSGNVHHDVASWALKGMMTQRLEMDRDQDSVRAVALILFVGLLFISELMKLDWVLKRDKRDLRHGAKTIIKTLRSFLLCENVKSHSGLPPSIGPAIQEIWSQASGN